MENVYDLLKRIEFLGDDDTCPECAGTENVSKFTPRTEPSMLDRGHGWGCKLRAHLDFDILNRGRGIITVKGMDGVRGELKGRLLDFRYLGAQVLIELEDGEQIWCASIRRPQF